MYSNSPSSKFQVPASFLLFVSLGAVACATGTSVATEDEELGSTPTASPSIPGQVPSTKPTTSPTTPSPSGTASSDAAAPPNPPPANPDASVPPTPPPASTGNVVNGTSSGVSIVATDGWALVTASGSRVTSVAVAVQDRTAGCSDYGVGVDRPNVSKLRIQVYVNPQGVQSLAPGTFSIGSNGGVFADALLAKSDTSCSNMVSSPANKATSGTVTISAFQPVTKGTFDVTFPGGRMTGSFDAPQCTKNPAGGTSCVP